MKKLVKFSAFFLPAVVISAAIVLSGVAGLFTRGINLGIDFQAGFIEQVTMAPTAFTLRYSGSQTVTVSRSNTAISLVSTGVGSENVTYTFSYAEYPTLGQLASAMSAVPGLTVALRSPAATETRSVFPDASALTRLSSSEPYRFHYRSSEAPVVTSDDIRAAISEYADAAVQVVGDPADQTFQIRLKDDGSDPEASVNLRNGLTAELVSAFGDDNIAVISSDFVGSRFSKSLSQQATLLVIATLALIWLYATIRFRWDFALGAVLAIAHDALIIVAFIVWTRMQFNTTTIAAILTIIGYSINDTIVVFDRIRENMKFHQGKTITQILDISQTEVLGRTVITTLTTMLAVSALYIFTTGDMKNFALALLVGMTSGVYSTIYIAGAFISFVSRFRKDKGLIVEKAPVKAVASGELV